jgi:FtsP/CotA-like multicopper oxidase with cupredoxin domain
MASATSVHLVGVGSCTITAAQAGNTNYSAATSVARTFAVLAPAGPTVTFDLYAVAGSTTLPGSVTVPVWGYNTTNAAVTKPGGPVLIVNQNENVVITLHNQLAESTALLFQGQNMIPDTTGASAGGTNTYSFVARQPGTFLYEAGLMTGSQHQVAMGLYGTLIVRPTGFASAPGQAYGSAASAFNTEQVLVLSELDTALNSSSNPATFDMRKYSPKYYLINGQAYPNTPNLSVVAGDKVLLRYVDAGLQAHAMSTLGLSQLLVGQDGSATAYPHAVVAETIAPGQTLDAIVSIPASAALGAQFPLYDASLFLRNNKGTATNAGLGGMLTFLKTDVGALRDPIQPDPYSHRLPLPLIRPMARLVLRLLSLPTTPPPATATSPLRNIGSMAMLYTRLLQ